jgi:hypothetical protein
MPPEPDLPKEAGSGPIFHPDWGTHAYAAYNANTTGLDALLALAFGLPGATPEQLADLQTNRRSINDAFSGPWAIDVDHTMLSWQVAMRVSAVEVYLQDALTFLAVYDSEFIRSRASVQTWDYDAIRRASDKGDAVWTFCNNWARSFVGDGGPSRWARALTGAGLGKFSDAEVASLEAMWGYRHLRIHNGGRFSPEFVTRHREVAERLWRDGLKQSDLSEWRKTADTFVGTAEQGIAGRLRARLGKKLIKQRERAEMNRQFKMLDERMWNNLLAKHPEARERYIATKRDKEKRRTLLFELLGIPPEADLINKPD